MLVDRICDEYELALRAGRGPRLEDYLADAPAGHREELLVELLRIEIDLLREMHAPGPDILCNRHPALVGMIGQLWGEAERADGTVRVVQHRFRIIAPIGQGGEGVVFLARDEELGRTVVIKELLPARPDAGRAVERFENETRVTGLLEHPGILPVFAVGRRDETRPFFVTRHVPGPTLDGVLAEFHAQHAACRRVEWTIAMRALLRRYIEVCDVVRHAHSRGVVHRDLKPANLLVGRHGETVVIDWGLARVLDERQFEGTLDPVSGDLAEPATRGLTVAGDMLGTPGYASPEQYDPQARGSGFATDVYGLGATLYHLLTGRRPFDEILGHRDEVTPSRLARLADAVRTSVPPSPRTIESRVPKPLDAVCRRAMQADPAARYPSVEALANDVAAWLDGAPMSVAPHRPWHRAWRWARRHRLSSGAIASAVILAVALAAWASLRGALERARATPLVDQIEAADPAQIPPLVALFPDVAAARGLVTERLAASTKPDARRSLRLAALRFDPAGAADFGRDLGTDAAFRRELALALSRPGSESLRDLLRPVADVLVDDLLALEATAVEGDSEAWRQTRRALLQLAPRRPDALARGLAHAQDVEFGDFLEALRKDPPSARRELRRLLDEAADWSHADVVDPSWGEPVPEALHRVEAATGLAGRHFLVVQALPLEEFLPLAETIRPAGFRPARTRPYRAADGRLLVAATWARDGARFAFDRDLTAAEVERRDADHRAEGLASADVALYPGDDGATRYAALWVAPDPVHRESRLSRARRPAELAAGIDSSPGRPPYLVAGLSTSVLERDEWDRIRSHWRARTTQFRRTAAGLELAQIREGEDAERGFAFVLGDSEALADARAHRLMQWDVCIGPAPSSPDASRGPEYLTTWTRPGWQASELATGPDIAAHLAQMRELAGRGFRPLSISVGPGGAPAATVWGRPAQHPHHVAPSDRAARVAVALFHLAAPEPLWALLRHGPDPTARSYLIEALPRLEVPAGALQDRLAVEPDVSARRALLLALGGYPAPAASDPFIDRVADLVRRDPDPGIHAAACWLLGEWGLAARRDAALAAVSRTDAPPPGRGWFVNSQGQMLTVVRGGPAFVMGQAEWDFVDERLWLPHRVRIDRDFAIAATEVSAAQFQRYREAMVRRGVAVKGSPLTPFGREPDGPALGVDFFAAARYCNWLSAEAGIPPDQWCFEERPGGELALRAGLLERTGYRLPTEAEWEYACRAGAETFRQFGRQGDSLLGRYAWCIAGNAGNQAWPVGLLKPNDLGLFDMLGNAHEWCLDPFARYCRGRCHVEEPDVVPDGPVDPAGNRVLRGGWFNLPDEGVTPGARSWGRADDGSFQAGFRVARTLPRGPG